MRRTFMVDLRLHRNEVLVREEGELAFELNPQKSKPQVLMDQDGTLWVLREYPNSVERYVPVVGGPVECVYTRKGDGSGNAG